MQALQHGKTAKEYEQPTTFGCHDAESNGQRGCGCHVTTGKGSRSGIEARDLVECPIKPPQPGCFQRGKIEVDLAREPDRGKRFALWGLAFAMYPGFVYSIGFDLAEVLAGAFLLAGLLFARRRRWVATAVFLSFAVLTRETTAIVPISLGLAWLWDRRQAVSTRIGPISRGRLMAGIVPLAIAVGWQLDVRARWGQFPLASSGDKNLRFPFAGLADTFGKMLPPSSGAEAFRWLSLGFVVGVLGLGFAAIRRSTAESHEKIALVAGTILLTLLSPFIWGGATSFMRATTESCLLAILIILGAPRPNIRRLLIAPVGVIAAVTAASEVAKAR